MKIAVLQLNSIDDYDSNLNQIFDLITESLRQNNDNKTQKPSLYILPENALYFRINEKDTNFGVSIESLVIEKIVNFCKLHQVSLHLTSAFFLNDQERQKALQNNNGNPLKSVKLKEALVKPESNKMSNASILISSHGEISLIYEKIHLFDIQLKDQKPIKESDVFNYGQAVSFFEWEGFKIGSSICYDLRFSELFKCHADNLVDVILIPAAFLVTTGEAHWEVLVRARAIENQCYVIAPAQWGEHKSFRDSSLKRFTYGHSLIVNPWGKIEGEIESGVGCLEFELSREEILKVRTQIPMNQHRRI